MRQLTATQVFLFFLKYYCSRNEFLFFRHIIINKCGNRYFKKRRLWKDTLVESYLANNNRTMMGFMKRVFILAPNLIYWSNRNQVYREYLRQRHKIGKPSIFVNYYHKKWQQFLQAYVVPINKPLYSRFRKGEENVYYIKWEK